MKILRFLSAMSCMFLLTSCWFVGLGEEDDFEPPQQLQEYDAVIMSRPEFESAVQLLSPRDVVKSGKIYVKEDFLFVNDVNKGFHIYQYNDSQNPVAVGFLQIPGATDLAIRGNNLYINQAVDLVTLKYDSGLNTITITKRNNDVFPQKPAPDFSYADVSENQIIIDWTPTN